MRTGKGKRRRNQSPVSNQNESPDRNHIRRESVVWISKDDGDPRSPLSVERLPQIARRRISKVARVKSKRNLTPKRKGINSEPTFPFFIDKTPTTIQDTLSRKKRRRDLNDSIIVLDSPTSSRSVNQFLQPERKKSVDTVDLCSDSEDEQEVRKRKSKSKKKTIGQTTTKKLNDNVSNVSSPDIIVLDDEESTNSVCDSNPSIIAQPISTSSSTQSSSRETNEKSCSDKTQENTTDKTGSSSVPGQPLPTNNFPPPGPSNFIPLNAFDVPLIPISLNPPSNTGPLTSLASNASLIPNPFANTGPSTSFGPTSTAMTGGSNLQNRNHTFIRKLPDVQKPVFSESMFGLSRNVFIEKNSENSLVPSDVGTNVFNPNGNMKQTGLRPIIIDGCNVAIGHGGDRIFSVRGLCICVEFFLRRGHENVLAIVPLHHRCKVSPRDRDILESLRNDNHLVYTPSRFVDNRLISSYDDRYIVQYAAATGGVIVSRDNYRDLLRENPAWKDTILNRLLMPTWVGDILMFPVDPLGKKGPNLDEFLRFPNE